MTEIHHVSGNAIPLLLDDIDTDRIIPARYLRCVTFDGLGEHAFKDDRQHDPNHPFDHEHYQDGSVLFVGRNFGCGSSREHAPQALMRFGVRAIVGESFAEIFFGNCVGLGIPAVTVSRDDLERIAAMIADRPKTHVVVHLHDKEVRLAQAEGESPHFSVACDIPESARTALISGQFDFLSQLLEGRSDIAETADNLPYLCW